MTQNRLIRWIIMLVLPLVVLLGWYATEQAPSWFANVPAWLRPNWTEPFPGACEALASVDAYDGAFIRHYVPAALQPNDATARAREIVQTHYDITLPDEARLSPPVLVRATFPGSGEHLTWLVIAVLPKDDGSRFDRAAIAFIDSETGDPRALDTAVSVTDARTACGGGPVGRRELVRQYLPLLLAAAYTGLVVVGILVRRWWLRRRAQ